ncbi:MAG: [FeFe] hydrogenase H-cluster radical SAM maturase HydG [Mucinivorans sp.]
MMIFEPQRYKIVDKIGEPFIDEEEILDFLTIQPTAQQVDQVISRAKDKHRLTLRQTAILLNAPNREPIMRAAKELKQAVYGNRIVLFAPLYVGNMCANSCEYCSFRTENRVTVRKTLAPDEITQQVDALTAQGHKRLILVYGEHPLYSAEFIARNVRQVYENKNIRRVNINAAPMTTDDFRTIHQAKIGTFQVFQESYFQDTYRTHHPRGRKADYPWRLTALDRAMEAGIDDVGLGALFGLQQDWRREVMGLIRHTNHLESCFGVGPHTISFPRITPAAGVVPANQYPVADDDFLFLVAVLRLAVPYTGLILTARESQAVRHQAIAYGVSQIDAGTHIEIGGYSAARDTENEGGAQFTINDSRSLSQVISSLVESDFLPSFCTACYRKGRTGEHFMEFSTRGFIKRFCTPNAILTFAEYLEDYATAQDRQNGYDLIEREVAALQETKDLVDKLSRIKKGERDLYF